MLSPCILICFLFSFSCISRLQILICKKNQKKKPKKQNKTKTPSRFHITEQKDLHGSKLNESQNYLRNLMFCCHRLPAESCGKRSKI